MIPGTWNSRFWVTLSDFFPHAVFFPLIADSSTLFHWNRVLFHFSSFVLQLQITSACTYFFVIFIILIPFPFPSFLLIQFPEFMSLHRSPVSCHMQSMTQSIIYIFVLASDFRCRRSFCSPEHHDRWDLEQRHLPHMDSFPNGWKQFNYGVHDPILEGGCTCAAVSCVSIAACPLLVSLSVGQRG